MSGSGEKDENKRVPQEGAPALDDVKTAREAEAVVAKRRAEEEAAKASRPVESESRPSGDSPKRQGDKLSDAVREASREPVIEDEP
jgi:hypothetical protein